MDQAVRRWADVAVASRWGIVRIGYFGSYARGDWGVGSDLDIIVVVKSIDKPFERRGAGWHAEDLPVPADLLVYTTEEWARVTSGGRFGETLLREAVWVYRRNN